MEVRISFTLKYRCSILIFLKVWAATCRNDDYIRSVGMSEIVHSHDHRQEIVAGGLGEHLVKGVYNFSALKIMS